MKSKSWNILAPGPNLERTATADEMLDGPVVAVNQAIAFYARADVWCWRRNLHDRREKGGCGGSLIEKLDALGTNVAAALRHDPIVWTQAACKAHSFRKLDGFELDEDTRFQFFGSGLWDEPFWNVLPWKSHVNWTCSPTLVAIGMAIKYGAAQVKVFGADMAGYDSWGINYAEMEVKPNAVDVRARWARERRVWREMVEECAAHQVTVERGVDEEREAQWLEQAARPLGAPQPGAGLKPSEEDVHQAEAILAAAGGPSPVPETVRSPEQAAEAMRAVPRGGYASGPATVAGMTAPPSLGDLEVESGGGGRGNRVPGLEQRLESKFGEEADVVGDITEDA